MNGRMIADARTNERRSEGVWAAAPVEEYECVFVYRANRRDGNSTCQALRLVNAALPLPRLCLAMVSMPTMLLIPHVTW